MSGPSELTADCTCYRPADALAHPLWRRCTRQGGRRCPTWWRTVEWDEPRSVPEESQERSWVDVSVADAKPEVEPVGRGADGVALAHLRCDGHARRRQSAIRRRATIGLFDHHIPHAGDHPVERDNSRRSGNDARARCRLILQSSVPRAVRARRRTERVDDS